jgi:hypothetical protein
MLYLFHPLQSAAKRELSAILAAIEMPPHADDVPRLVEEFLISASPNPTHLRNGTNDSARSLVRYLPSTKKWHRCHFECGWSNCSDSLIKVPF